MVEQKYTSSEAALKLNCSPQNVNKILRLAKTKISKFYSNYPKVTIAAKILNEVMFWKSTEIFI